MATKYPQSAQTGDRGVALVRQICADAAGLFRSFETSDIGIDGAIEFLTNDRGPTGDMVLVQIKTGSSYIRSGRFFIAADKDHFESWARYAVPVAGIVCNAEAAEARWVDISGHLRQHPEIIAQGPYTIEAPASQPFSVAAFPQFSEHFIRNAADVTRVDVTPNLLIRPWHPEDARPTRALLSAIAPDYPNFDNWLTKKFSDANASKKVVAVGDVIAAFSMWQAKDQRNIKLQTFIVGQSYRGTAIGQHLLYHELRTWADDSMIERVHVTVASSKADLIEYFRAFGFRVEGFSANRYPRPAAELVMAKHFLREVVRTPSDLDRLAQFLYERIWGLSADDNRFEVAAADFAVPAVFPGAVMTVNRRLLTSSSRILVKDKNGVELLRHGDESLMREFYPLRLHLASKKYVLIPIYPNWADAMLSTRDPHTPLKLRVDNVYYCYPKLPDLSSGDLVLFYETKRGGGKGAAIGAAIVQEVAIDQPSRLYERFAKLGIYQLHDVTSHANGCGKAMAIKFSLFEPFSHSVTLTEIINHLGHKTNVQGLTPIPREVFEAIRTSGLS
jgi:ribosomal protein S18 acetylase RimI-like enzyme